jgi:hypothetical protein
VRLVRVLRAEDAVAMDDFVLHDDRLHRLLHVRCIGPGGQEARIRVGVISWVGSTVVWGRVRFRWSATTEDGVDETAQESFALEQTMCK